MKEIDKQKLEYLVLLYQITKEDCFYEEIYETTKEYAFFVMRKFAKESRVQNMSDEYASIIHISLFEALLRFDQSKNTSFMTYLYYFLKEKYYDRYLENSNTLSASRNVKKKSLAEITLDFVDVELLMNNEKNAVYNE